MADHAHAHEHEHPNYVKVWGILVVLLCISIAGPMIGIKAVTIITAFGIAIIKAYLVAKNFMHISIEPKFVTYIVSTVLLLMGLLFFFVSPDVMKHDGQNWENRAAKDAVEGKLAVGPGAEGEFSAEQTFQTVCATCHGPNGDGKGEGAAGLATKPANFTDPKFWGSRSKDSIIKVITGGGPAVGKSPLMAAYGEAYTEEQIEQLAEYVMEFR